MLVLLNLICSQTIPVKMPAGYFVGISRLYSFYRKVKGPEGEPVQW